MKKKEKRSEENIKISISMSKKLLADIDARAKAENRTRSNMIQVMTNEQIQKITGGKSLEERTAHLAAEMEQQKEKQKK